MNNTHTFKGFDDFIEVFKAGSHIDSKGQPFTCTAANLDALINNTPANTAPMVIGHPTTDAPAYGWVNEFKRDGDALLVKFNQVNPEFATLVENGAYKKRSVSIGTNDNGLYLKHVGWLGAAAPAIKGLADVAFSEDASAVSIEFSEFSEEDAFAKVGDMFNTVGNLFRSMREQMIADKGIEAADRFFSDWMITDLQTASESIMARLEGENDGALAFAQADVEAAFTAHVMARANVQIDADAQAAQVQAATDKAQAESAAQFAEREAAQATKITQLESQLARQHIDAQVDKWTTSGKLTPALSAGVAEFMSGLSDGQSFEFAASEGSANVTAHHWFAAFVEKLPNINIGQEQGGGTPSAAPLSGANEIASKAAEFVAAQGAAGISVSIVDAVAHVTRQL